MITNYRPPRHEIEQDFADEAPNPEDRNNVIVIGPAYVHADPIADNMVKEDFALAGVYSYKYLDSEGAPVTKSVTQLIDSPWTSLYAYAIWLQLYQKGSAGAVAANDAFNAYPDDRTGNTLIYNTAGGTGFYDENNTTPAADFDLGRAPQPGDILRITGDKATVDRKIVKWAGKDVAASSSNYGFFGAGVLAGAASAPVTGVIHSDAVILAGDITLNTAAPSGDDLEDFARRYGSINATAGLDLKFALEVTTAGNADTAVFSLTIQGRSVAVTNADDLATGTNFTILGETLNVDHAAWALGETLSFTITMPSAAETYPLTASEVVLAADYNFVNATKKIASSIIVEVTDVSLDGATVKVRVSDTQGLLTPQGYTITGADTLAVDYDGVTDGLTVGFTLDFFNNCHVGQRLSASITPPSRSTTVFDKVVLDAPVGDILTAYDNTKDSLAVTAFVKYTGEVEAIESISGDTNFTINAEDVTLAAAVKVAVSGYTLATDSVKNALTGIGQVAVSWRALEPVSANESPFLVTGTSEILSEVGSLDTASEMGFGLLKALQAAEKGVYGLRVGGTDTTAWQTAIDKLATLRNIYALVPLTDDKAVLQLFAAHAAEMNQPAIKKFRRVYGNVDSPGEYTKYSQLSDQSPTTATVTLGAGSEYTLVTYDQAEVDLTTKKIYEGDKLKVVSTGIEYEIDYVGNDKTLILKSGPASPITAPTAVEIIAADTAQNVTDFVKDYAGSLGTGLEEDRRISCIWTDDGTADGQVIPNRFIAAEIGGHRVRLLPQQGLTRQAISTITDAPSMYSRYTETQLNDMAANGVWIITQEGPDLTPYVRHQLTTAADGGPLRYEDSAGVIYDFLSFDVDDVIDPLIGKRNVTQRTLVEVKNLLLEILNDATTAPVGADEFIGPRIVAFFDRDDNEGTLNVDFDPEFKDAIVVYAVIEVPLSLNNVKTRLLARTINTETGASSEIVIQAS